MRLPFGIPSVTLAEWAELSRWFLGRLESLRKLTKDGQIRMDGDRVISLYSLDYAARYQTAKSMGIGLVARDLRDLRAKVEPAIAAQR
jgi:hypothetical protein